MAKGSQFKKEVLNKMLETFSNSFLYNDGKELRICGQENGEDIQLKCVLTCAKVNVEKDGDIAIPGEVENKIPETKNEKTIVMPTQEEKDNVKNLLESFGL